MHLGLAALFGGKGDAPDAASAGRPSETQLRQQAAQGGGLDITKDNMARDDRKRRAMRMVGNRIAMKQVREDSGVGRVNATKKKRQ